MNYSVNTNHEQLTKRLYVKGLRQFFLESLPVSFTVGYLKPRNIITEYAYHEGITDALMFLHYRPLDLTFVQGNVGYIPEETN